MRPAQGTGGPEYIETHGQWRILRREIKHHPVQVPLSDYFFSPGDQRLHEDITQEIGNTDKP
jgi:hypothetical protein